MFQSDKRLLWHPRKTNKFVVGGNSQITLYEWASEYPEIRHVTSQHDLHFMKCFAWSPDPAFEDLMAVGLTTGKVDLIRLEAGKQAQQKNILSSGPTVTLPIRNSRSCNALAFSDADPNYLAVGLDKVRGASSLIIWDISTFTSSLTLPITSPNNGTPPSPRRPRPQIPKLDHQATSRMDQYILQRHAPTEVVSSLAFLPSSTHLLLAGISHRWLRLFDLRSQTTGINVASKVNGIATDPFDPYRIACFGDGVVNVWDARKLQQPLLMFSERDAIAGGTRVRPGAVYTNIEFSSTRRGCLATLEKDSTYVRFWDLLEVKMHTAEENMASGSRVPDGEIRTTSGDATRASRRSWAANLPWPAGDKQLSPKQRETFELSSQTSFIVSDTRRTKYFPRSLASFALLPNPNVSHPLASNVMVVNKDGDLELYAIYDTPKQPIWSSRGDLAIGAGVGLKIIGDHKNTTPVDSFSSESVRRSRSALKYNKDKASSSRSIPTREHSRGRSGHPVQAVPPNFGLGADDSLPVASTGLSATRPARTRTGSPVSVQKHRRSHSRTDTIPAEESTSPRRTTKRDMKKHGLIHVLQNDISMVMKRRALDGYGLSKPQDNTKITLENRGLSDGVSRTLSDLWEWIGHSQEVLCVPTPRLCGYDFSYQGLLGIWEGFNPSSAPMPMQHFSESTPIPGQRSLLLDLPVGQVHHSHAGSSTVSGARSHSPADDLFGSWSAALHSLTARRKDHSGWKPTVPTEKLVQRQIALQVCGWSVREEEISASVKRWEKEGHLSHAACWLVFTRQYGKAVDMLMRSNDETHQMMSGTIAALAPHGPHSGSAKNAELRDHYARLVIRLHDPYFRVLLTHLAVGDWSDILEEEVIPFRERLAIAFQFLDDKSLSSYLRRMTEQACSRGDIDAIILTGLTLSGMDVLQSYVDRTGDVQSAAILSSYVCPQRFKDRRAERWLESYRDLLDGFKLHHHRVGFDIERGQILHEAMQNGDMAQEEWVPRQITIRCHYCNKPVQNSQQPKLGKPTTCSNCGRDLPRCSVCLVTLSIVHDAAREADLEYTYNRDTFDDAIVICQTCRHGGHAVHILEWFLNEDGRRTHDVCPVVDCNCRCAEDS